MQLNAEVLCCTAEIWVSVFDFEAAGHVPRTPPLGMISTEATGHCKNVKIPHHIISKSLTYHSYYIYLMYDLVGKYQMNSDKSCVFLESGSPR